MDFSDKCACCGGNLDRFLQPIILSILAGGPKTGYAIVKEIARYSTFRGRGPDPTGVYRYLKIMLLKGMLEKPGSEENGEKSLFTITESGASCLTKWQETLEEYSRQIDVLRTEIAQSVSV